MWRRRWRDFSAGIAGRSTTSPDPPPDPPTGSVGLERSGIRPAGKATATLLLLGDATAAIVLFASGKTGLAIVLLAALAVLIAAIVTWSERSSET
jgi:hypothetical protein